MQPNVSRTIMDVKTPILQLIKLFPLTKTIYCDNEAAFNSKTIRTLLKNGYDINIVNAPPLQSCSNGQVESFHGTLADIARAFKLEKIFNDTVELILRATAGHNRSIHSIMNLTPIDIIHAASSELRQTIKKKNAKAQHDSIERANPNRRNRVFKVGERVCVKNNKRLGNTLTQLSTEETI